MIRRAGAFFILFLWAGYVSGQVDLQSKMNPQDEWEIAHNKAHKVKTCTIYSKYSIGKEYLSEINTFTDQGHMLSSKKLNSRGETVEESKYDYDRKGRLTYLKEGTLDLEFTYSKKGIREIKGTNEGQPVQWNHGNRTLILFYRQELKKTEYTFNGIGAIIKLDEQNDAGLENNKDLLIAYTYTKDGQLASIERKEVAEDSDHSHTTRKYVYNDAGQLIQVDHKMQNDYTWYDEITTYTYAGDRLLETRMKNEADFAKEILVFNEKGLLTGRHYYMISQEAGGNINEELSETLRLEYELR